MLTFDQAIGLLAEAVKPLDTEQLAIDQSAGRFLAQDLHARCDAPRGAVSAMDGYAVIEAHTEPGNWFDCVGESRAGSAQAERITRGQAMRIFTGAKLPPGANMVIMQEYAEHKGSRVRFKEGFGPGTHVRAAGSDFRAQDLLVPAGTRLSPRGIVAAAAADVASVGVYRKPRLSIIATGDELAPSGSAYQHAGHLPETAGLGVAAMADEAGADVVGRSLGRDDLNELTGLAGEALDIADCVVVTGGASVGDFDLARPMFASYGLEEVFSRISIRPGRPVWFGHVGQRLVLGLPGNPTSAMVTARLFLRPLLALLQGGSAEAELQFQPHLLAEDLPSVGPRETFVRASSTHKGLHPVSNQESGAQLPLLRSDWLIRRPAGSKAAEHGAIVQALQF